MGTPSTPALHPYPAHPVKVVRVSGTDREMGRQHAEQTGAAVGCGMARFYYEFWRRMFSSARGRGIGGAALSAAKWMVDPFLVRRLAGKVPKGLRERIDGVSEVSGLATDQLLTSLVLPDLLPILQAYLARIRPGSFVEVQLPRFGCSSFIARGEHFLVGRNLDFPGVAYWDRYPVIEVATPREGLRYIGFVSAGVPFSGITGVNEAQVFVALHQHYSRSVSLSGVLPFAIAEDVLRRARSLEEAKAILDSSPVASSWAFIVADGKARDGFIYEARPGACGTLPLSETGVLAHSNFFQTPSCRTAEYAATARMNWDNGARKRRLEELVAGAGTGLSPAVATQALSDHFDPYWGEEKTVNRTVSQVYNIQSLVLDPVNMRAWLAEGDAPIHLRRFREWDLAALLDGRDGDTGRELPAYTFQSPGNRTAKETYILGFIAAFDGKLEASVPWLEQSLEAAYSAEAGLVLGVLRLKLGDLDRGLHSLEQAQAFLRDKMRARGKTQPPPEYFEVGLFHARALDLLGRRSEAVRAYREVADHPGLQDVNLRRLASTGRPYRREQLERILAPFSSYIPFQ